ncbi:HEPN domain-containing protein [Pseudomonas vlassakiae]|uniref:HEPN domain-containing protein n=1 Tax=Pseudomonas vlassakiae TaxID=485888 RepID=UPI0021C803C9|nr:HEPN domain-containing protein [Pseudomonas vlassakiae]MCU0126605.1 HEPN domain-containing protein [Pseudomonas vlassakiae]
MKKITYMTAVDYLFIPDKFSLSVGFDDCLTLTNDVELIKRLINKVHSANMGVLEYNHLVSGRPILYSVREYRGAVNVDDELLDFLREVQSFFVEIWIHHDNSINCQQAFALQTDGVTSVNCLPVFNSAANGENLGLKVSSVAIKKLLDSSPVAVESIREQAMPDGTGLRKSRGRINIAMMHLQAARNHRDLGFKIMCYCSLFEAVFSTDKVELAHQLSQRLAFFVGASANERVEIYRLTKKAYGIRSSAVHGDVLDKNLSDLAELAVHCDKIARKVFVKFFRDVDLFNLFNYHSKDRVFNYLLHLVLGGNEFQNL